MATVLSGQGIEFHKSHSCGSIFTGDSQRIETRLQAKDHAGVLAFRIEWERAHVLARLDDRCNAPPWQTERLDAF